MPRLQQFVSNVVGHRLFWVGFCAITFGGPVVGGLLRRPPEAIPVLATLPGFSLESAEAEAVTARSIGGRVWVGAFLDPNCPDCLTRTIASLSRLQSRTRNLGPAFRILAVSTDPNTSQQWLADQAREGHANPRVWWFTRGGDGQKLAASIRTLGGTDSGGLFLVDGAMAVRGLYSMEEQDLNRLLSNLALIVNQTRW